MMAYGRICGSLSWPNSDYRRSEQCFDDPFNNGSVLQYKHSGFRPCTGEYLNSVLVTYQASIALVVRVFWLL